MILSEQVTFIVSAKAVDYAFISIIKQKHLNRVGSFVNINTVASVRLEFYGPMVYIHNHALHTCDSVFFYKNIFNREYTCATGVSASAVPVQGRISLTLNIFLRDRTWQLQRSATRTVVFVSLFSFFFSTTIITFTIVT